MAGTPVANSIEAEFARRLADNEKKTRDRAIRKLKQFINLRSQKLNGGFSRDEMLRIWKGLFYCMWMSDKPLVQEELAKTISGLMLQVTNVKTVMLLFETFLTTMEREWKGIDRLRMDKFYLLVRCMLNKGLEFLKLQEWDDGTVDWFIAILKNGPMSHTVPAIGIHYHFSDIYVEELSKIGGSEISQEIVAKFLDPYCVLITKSRNFDFVKAVKENVFQELIENSGVALAALKEEELAFADAGGHSQLPATDLAPFLNVSYKAIADRIFELASDADVLSRNRKKAYLVVKQFRELGEGRLPLDNIPDIDYFSDDELKKAEENLVDTLVTEETKGLIQKRKRTRGKKRKKEILRALKQQELEDEVEPELGSTDSVGEEEATQEEKVPKKKKKKRISVTEKIGGDGKGDESSSNDQNQSISTSEADVDTGEEPNNTENNTKKKRKRKKKNVTMVQADTCAKKADQNDAAIKKEEDSLSDQDVVAKSDHFGSGPMKKKKRPKKTISATRREVEPKDLQKDQTIDIERQNFDSEDRLKTQKVEVGNVNEVEAAAAKSSIPDILQNVPHSETLCKAKPKKTEAFSKSEKLLSDWLKTGKPQQKDAKNTSDSESGPEPKKLVKKKRKHLKSVDAKQSAALETGVKDVAVETNLVSQHLGKKSKKLAEAQGKMLVTIEPNKQPPATSTFFRVASSKVKTSLENKHLAAVKRKNSHPVQAHSPKRVAFEMSKTQVQPFRKTDRSIAVSPSPNNIAFDPRKKPDFGLLKTRKNSTDQSMTQRRSASDFF